jgi:hypothetical protein
MINSLDEKTRSETINKLRKLLLLPSMTGITYKTLKNNNE